VKFSGDDDAFLSSPFPTFYIANEKFAEFFMSSFNWFFIASFGSRLSELIIQLHMTFEWRVERKKQEKLDADFCNFYKLFSSLLMIYRFFFVCKEVSSSIFRFSRVSTSFQSKLHNF
jgi:hypothetical protein